MTNSEVTQRVEKVFRSVFGRKARFSDSLARIDEPAWTSLKHVEFIIALEMEFTTRFDGSDATDMIAIPVILNRVGSRVR